MATIDRKGWLIVGTLLALTALGLTVATRHNRQQTYLSAPASAALVKAVNMQYNQLVHAHKQGTSVAAFGALGPATSLLIQTTRSKRVSDGYVGHVRIVTYHEGGQSKVHDHYVRIVRGADEDWSVRWGEPALDYYIGR